MRCGWEYEFPEEEMEGLGKSLTASRIVGITLGGRIHFYTGDYSLSIPADGEGKVIIESSNVSNLPRQLNVGDVTLYFARGESN